MRVFGIDPGSDRTGYGCIDSDGRVHQLIRCGAVRAVTGATFPDQLSIIYRELTALLAEHRPECVAIENIFYATNARSALKLGHARGVAMDSTIVRADGRQEPLLDVGFDFNNQRMLDTPAVLQMGDRVVTRCHFLNDSDAPIISGFNAGNEMCNLFVYAWPAGALSSVLNVVPGTCLW